MVKYRWSILRMTMGSIARSQVNKLNGRISLGGVSGLWRSGCRCGSRHGTGGVDMEQQEGKKRTDLFLSRFSQWWNLKLAPWIGFHFCLGLPGMRPLLLTSQGKGTCQEKRPPSTCSSKDHRPGALPDHGRAREQAGAGGHAGLTGTRGAPQG